MLSRRIFTIVFLFFTFFANSQTVDDFIFTIDMNSTMTYDFTITGNGTITVNWGDGLTDTYTNPVDQNIVHTYSSNSVFTIIINNAIDSFRFNRDETLTVTQWGTSTWQTMNSAFERCNNLIIAASDVPDLSQVIDMSFMFLQSINFNSDISNWDVSSVTDMNAMFNAAASFNQPLNSWDVSNVTNMVAMFSGTPFNQPLDNWDVSNVTNMHRMLSYTPFNQPLNNWDVSNVITMEAMFLQNSDFNQPLNNWNVSNVTTMKDMFTATAFNQPIDTWNVSSVVTTNSMFVGSSFDQPLNSWDVSNVTDTSGMFAFSQFNQPLDNWDVSNMIQMQGMFQVASNFNQDLSSWDFHPSVGLNYFLTETAIDTNNFDTLLQRFVNLNLVNKVFWNLRGFGTTLFKIKYCDSFSRSILIQRGWLFRGDERSHICTIKNLNGTVRFDIGNDGCGLNDPLSTGTNLRISNGAQELDVFTLNGDYELYLPPGTYTVTPQVNTSFFNVAPVSANPVVVGSGTITQDFCLTGTSPVDDLEISILPLEEARPGFDTNYKFVYKNKGNTQLSGSINFTYENDYMNFLTATPAVTTSGVGSLNWTFSNLDPFETREIELSMNLNTPTDPNFPLNSNDILNFNATINPTINDNTPLDNVFDLHQTVVNSYDPNDKTCLQGETIDPSMVGEFVHYRIRFENEGTASAITVRIVDYIDTTKFDISTLTPLSASHDFITTITDGNKVEFLFDNINLPFTAPASQGYVLFKIKTVDTLVLGDSFTNQAEIYFDFNFPIITNLDTVTVAVPLSSTDVNSLNVSLYPNPAMDNVTVTSNEAFDNITIYDMNGRVIQTKSFDTGVFNHQLVTDQLTTGLYLVKISNGLQSYNQKLVKQ